MNLAGYFALWFKVVSCTSKQRQAREKEHLSTWQVGAYRDRARGVAFITSLLPFVTLGVGISFCFGREGSL